MGFLFVMTIWDCIYIWVHVHIGTMNSKYCGVQDICITHVITVNNLKNRFECYYVIYTFNPTVRLLVWIVLFIAGPLIAYYVVWVLQLSKAVPWPTVVNVCVIRPLVKDRLIGNHNTSSWFYTYCYCIP